MQSEGVMSNIVGGQKSGGTSYTSFRAGAYKLDRDHMGY